MGKLKKIITNKYFIFFVAFASMMAIIWNQKDLLCGSGDAHETWKVIKTFFDEEKYISYVMYKGVYAFLPGLICYHLSDLFGVDSWLFMKIFHAVGFAYITAVGMPFLIHGLFKKEIKSWQKYLFILIMLILEYNIFIFLSVDFMSLSLLILCMNSIIKLENKKILKYYDYIAPGLLLGTCTCLSGQFTPSALLLIGYALYVIVKKNNKKLKKIKDIKISKVLIISLLIFLSSLLATKGIDKIYVNKVVTPARERGEWLPNGSEWVMVGFTSNMLRINYPRDLPDNLGGIIIEKEGLDREQIAMGNVFYGYKGMGETILKYPVLFISRWTQRLLLGLLNDPFNYYPGKLIIPPIICLITMATFIYMFLLILKGMFKQVKDIFSFEFFVFLAFLFSALVPSIGHVENRYYFAIRTFIIGMVVLSPFLKNMVLGIIDFFKKFSFKKLKNYKINYNLVVGIMFVIVYILLYIAVYQSAGVDNSIYYTLFRR